MLIREVRTGTGFAVSVALTVPLEYGPLQEQRIKATETTNRHRITD
jgi:hypothetical protein